MAHEQPTDKPAADAPHLTRAVSPVAWERLRVASEAVAPQGAVALHCNRCEAFQGHMTATSLLAGGLCLRRSATLECRCCGLRWRYYQSPSESPS